MPDAAAVAADAWWGALIWQLQGKLVALPQLVGFI